MPRHHAALDGWRGIAAVMVALFHFQATTPVTDLPLLRNSWLFGDFFFVLSGFVIAANYRERLAEGFGIGKFIALRIGRLYPLHLFLLGLFLLSEIALAVVGMLAPSAARATFTGPTSLWALVTNVFLVQGLGLHSSVTWNPVAWSISTEMWAYLVFALIAVAARQRTNAVLVVLIALCMVICLPDGVRPAGTDRFVDIARCLYGFAVGALLWSAYEHLEGKSWVSGLGRGTATAIELATLVAAVVFLTYALEVPRHLLAPLAFAPAVLVYAFDRGLVSRFLQARPIAFLGVLSYSIYMVHVLVQTRIMLPATIALQKVTGIQLLVPAPPNSGQSLMFGANAIQGTIATLAMLALVIAVSAATYRWIEAPGRDAVRAWVSRRKAARMVTA